MFDQIVSERTARKPFAVAVSFSGQAVLLSLAILFPLVRPQVISTAHLTQFVPLLRPWGSPHPAQQKPGTMQVAPKPGLHVFSDHVFRQPAAVPAQIALIDDAPGVETLPGSAAFEGSPDGVFGVLPGPVIAPPKAAPQQPALKPTPAVTPRLRIGGKVQAAKILRQVKPVYRPLAKQARVSGIVRLDAVISREGTIESLQVVSGHPLLVPAALEAVRQWLYQPTLLNGDPVEVLTEIEVHFNLAE
jgi:periplasmic protein TonB